MFLKCFAPYSLLEKSQFFRQKLVQKQPRDICLRRHCFVTLQSQFNGFSPDRQTSVSLALISMVFVYNKVGVKLLQQTNPSFYTDHNPVCLVKGGAYCNPTFRLTSPSPQPASYVLVSIVLFQCFPVEIQKAFLFITDNIVDCEDCVCDSSYMWLVSN